MDERFGRFKGRVTSRMVGLLYTRLTRRALREAVYAERMLRLHVVKESPASVRAWDAEVKRRLDATLRRQQAMFRLVAEHDADGKIAREQFRNLLAVDADRPQIEEQAQASVERDESIEKTYGIPMPETPSVLQILDAIDADTEAVIGALRDGKLMPPSAIARLAGEEG